jgi:hypothetical protein
MATSKPIEIPWPLSSRPGLPTDLTFPLTAAEAVLIGGPESPGRLFNTYAEPISDPSAPNRGEPAPVLWRRSAGLTQFQTTATGQTGYRGGLQVVNLSYEIWSGNASTVDASGNYASLGSFPGTAPVSIARNLNSPPDVVAVDTGNGAYVLSGGGAPVLLGIIPQPNSVCFQDGYFFFTIGDGRVFASPINSLALNVLTFIKVQARSNASLLRGIAYQGNLLLFTTASCELWQDVANPAPNFPYQRLLVLETGLLQANAIAGFDDGFAELFWVAQDFGVYWMTPGSLQPIKISNPDLDRLLQWTNRVGLAIVCSCYSYAGKKLMVVQGPTWSWEFNLSTKKWNERTSLVGGLQGRWRGTGGHPAFGRFLMGDAQSGNLLAVDDANFSDVTLGLGTMGSPYVSSPMLMRMESGLVGAFPNRQAIRRADFQFVTGVGNPLTVANPQCAISMSQDNGRTWGPPRLRSLGQLWRSKSTRITVKNMGQSGPDGVRFRLDISDPVYTAFMRATLSDNPREF